MRYRTSLARVFALLVASSASTGLHAQGQDSTPGERNLLVMAEMLPGVYDNVNQNYFDGRRKLPDADRHPRIETTITRVKAPAFGKYAFLWVNRSSGAQPDAAPQVSYRIATLIAGPGADEVTMRHYFATGAETVPTAFAPEALASLNPADLRRTEGCDYYFRRRADQFRGAQRPKACRFEWEGERVYTDNEIELSRSGLWFIDHKFVVASGKRITGVASGEPFWLERARTFHCYVDIPGVGGGRDIPFRRYDGITLHDKGGSHWFTTQESPPREIGIRLTAVTWHVLNEANGNFNRNSMVLYIMEKVADGSVKEHGYAFTDPSVDRLGINLKWLLANCAMTPRDQARPEM